MFEKTEGRPAGYLVSFSMMLLFLLVLSYLLLSQLLFVGWLGSVPDYLAVALAVALWAIGLRRIWRARLMEPIINRLAQRLRVA